MCTKQETHDLLDRFYWFIVELHETMWIWKKTLNLALPTGGPEITEILRKQLDYWYGLKLLGTQTHAHTYIHRNTKLLEKKTKITHSGYSGHSSCMYWYSTSQNYMRKAPKLTSSETRPLPSGSYLKRFQEFTTEGDPWTWLKWHKTDNISTKELNATSETARKCSERPNPVILPSIGCEKLGFSTRKHCSYV